LNEENQTLLHKACEKGRPGIAESIIKMFIENGLPLNSKDQNSCTPLDCACIRGFDLISDVLDLKRPTVNGTPATYRYWIVKALLSARNKDGARLVKIKYDEIRPGSYSPLHWAIYWADIDLSRLLVIENPKLLFFVNDRDQVPFDLCRCSLNKAYNNQGRLVVNFLLDTVFEILMNIKKDMSNFEKFFDTINDNYNPDIKVIEAEKKKIGSLEVFSAIHKEGTKALAADLQQIVKLFYEGMKDKSKKKYGQLLITRIEENKLRDREIVESLDTFEIFTEKTILSSKSDHALSYYVYRLIIWFAFFERRSQLLQLIKKYHISPFMPNNSGKSVIHVLAEEGYYSTMALLLEKNYKYLNSAKKFSLDLVIDIPTTDYLNTPLHLAAMKGHRKIFDLILIKKHLGDVFRLNQRCITVLDTMPNKSSNEHIDNSYWDRIRSSFRARQEESMVASQPFEQLTNSFGKLKLVLQDYDFALVVSGDVEDGEQHLVYRQLQRINEDFKKTNPDARFEISNPIPGFSNKMENPTINEFGIIRNEKHIKSNYFIFLLKPSQELYNQMGDNMNFKVFNTNKGFKQVYIYDKYNNDNYEPLKNYEKQSIIMKLLEEEFDISKFMQNGFLLDFFPLHDFNERAEISTNFSSYFWDILVDPLVPGHHPKTLIPLTQLGLYHGLQNGYYFGFLSLLTTYMFPLGLTGICFHLFGVLYLERLNNHLIPIFVIILSIWSSLFTEAWNKREKEMAFSYDALNLIKDSQEIRDEYRGEYIIDEVTSNIRKEDTWTPNKRRLIVSFFFI